MLSTSIKQINKHNIQTQKEALESLQKDPAKLLQGVLPKEAFDINPQLKNSQPLIFPDNLRTPQFKGVGLAAKDANLVTNGPAAPAAALKFDHTNWDKAIAHAAQTGKPLVVKVGASWCLPCQIMKRNVMSNPELKKRLEKEATYVNIEIDRSGDSRNAKALAEKISENLGIEAYPTVYILTLENKNGKPVPKIIKEANSLDVNGFNRFLDARSNGLKVAAQGIKDAGFGTNQPATRP